MWTEATTGNGGAKQAMAVEWHDCGWVVAIEQRGADAVRQACIKPLPRVVPLAHAGRRQTKTMMKQRMGGGRRYEGFTLVELLTVIAIIAILAAMLLPVLSRVKLSAYRTQARVQVNDIATAIQAYDSAYGRFPVSPGAQQQAAAYGGGDITYCGGYFTNAAGTWPPTTATLPTYCDTSNSEVISILMDYTNFPDSTYGNFTANTNYQKNPQKTAFLNAKMSGWGPKPGAGAPLPGVGTDLVYRDPWGNPYIMTMDLNYDGQCQDAFYGVQSVSQQTANNPSGFNGLVNSVDTGGVGNHYQFHGSVMVWSMGQYGPATPSLSSFDASKPATDAANKNHILSWQQ